MEVSIELHHLFSSPVYVSEISSITKDEFEFIKKLEYELMFSGNGKYTKNKFVLDCSELTRLKEEVLNHVHIFSKEILRISDRTKFYLTNSWSVLHESNDWGQMHMHTNCLLSGVLYTKVHENSGNLVFHRNNLNSIFPTAIDIEYNQKNILNGRDWEITPKDNMIILFPSHVLHSIAKNESNQDRYSLAFNLFARGHLGKNEYELFLP